MQHRQTLDPGNTYVVEKNFWLGRFIDSTTLICLMGTLEGTAVLLLTVRDLSAWKIGFDSNLFAAAYSGVICSGVAYYVQGVVMRERGPVFVATFNPLCVVITAALGVVVLSESKDKRMTEDDEISKRLPVKSPVENRR
ncbi:hypothetical protein IGI04_022857 [Brassica rapa subsp. trilocularis]|uniref:WAT1-related protein n=1 Tax=Brassica rapa subsp. trilocularis TaxID=1813537 RepID=A0ABQ7M5L1_BRACM|nr:hypothetical protein IGI04_022857 [Brassica rapa subsp. trilocularis]